MISMKVENREIVIYQTSAGDDMPVKTDGETVWMTIEQMVKLRSAVIERSFFGI